MSLSAPDTTLLVAIGDIHGRFHRVDGWIHDLEAALGRAADVCLAVGDVEAFLDADSHARKAAKRAMPAEFADYAAGQRAFARPLYFIGGNNEDFDTLHPTPGGASLAHGVEYLGRAGVRTLGGLRVAYLSGIYAPRYIDTPLVTPRNAPTRKQAGYFRRGELAALARAADGGADVMLVHEWPRGLVAPVRAARRAPGRTLRAMRFPWVGNPETRTLVERVRPAWVLCGHSHVAFAAAIERGAASVTRVACLDQAARPEGAVFWIEWRGSTPVRAGWGTDGRACWRAGERWDESRTPAAGDATDESAQAATQKA